jgi:hypothetical protein
LGKEMEEKDWGESVEGDERREESTLNTCLLDDKNLCEIDESAEIEQYV